MRVRAATEDDVAAIQSVGRRAGALFATVDDPVIAACADDAPLTRDELVQWCLAGRAWVADLDGSIAGFVVVDLVDGCAHVEEVAVDPAHGRRGIGAALLDAVDRHARDERLDAVTLTTFRDVPWNRPWYERLGFRVLAEDELGPELRARRDHEEEHGLPAALRVCMRRDLDPAGS